MESRSVRRRIARRRAWPPQIAVSVTVSNARSISQSFLIMPGVAQEVTLAGYVQDQHEVRVITLPVTIKASIA